MSDYDSYRPEITYSEELPLSSTLEEKEEEKNTSTQKKQGGKKKKKRPKKQERVAKPAEKKMRMTAYHSKRKW